MVCCVDKHYNWWYNVSTLLNESKAYILMRLFCRKGDRKKT